MCLADVRRAAGVRTNQKLFLISFLWEPRISNFQLKSIFEMQVFHGGLAWSLDTNPYPGGYWYSKNCLFSELQRKSFVNGISAETDSCLFSSKDAKFFKWSCEIWFIAYRACYVLLSVASDRLLNINFEKVIATIRHSISWRRNAAIQVAEHWNTMETNARRVSHTFVNQFKQNLSSS